MEIPFSKYQGTGNDFIIIADWEGLIERALYQRHIAHYSHRRQGIGADGLILLKKREGYDFEMVYYNSDGNKSSMCGNGGRCVVAFAARMGWLKKEAIFWAADGEHKAKIADKEIALQMKNVDSWQRIGEDYLLDTGSPHYVRFVKALVNYGVVKNGRKLRNSPRFAEQGVNVNFAQFSKQGLELATYERGVEDETLSCGTGVVAAAIIAHHIQPQPSPIVVITKGGRLEVEFESKPSANKTSYENIWLKAAAEWVFDGLIKMY